MEERRGRFMNTNKKRDGKKGTIPNRGLEEACFSLIVSNKGLQALMITVN